MKSALLATAGLLLAPVLFAAPAKAGDYCREYNRDVIVGNHVEHAYGTACLRPDGDWEIVSSSPNADPYAILPPDLQGRVVRYYNYAPQQQVVVVPRYVNNGYYPYRASSSSFFFSFNNDHHHWDRGNRWYGNGNGNRDWHDNDRHDNDRHDGGGRGRH